jgi:diguanylate cyclase (GGDEF)-like protein
MRPDHLIDQLAELAGQRNRDLLDGCFLDLFHDLLEPLSVAIFRPDGDDHSPYWSLHRRVRDTAPGLLDLEPMQAPLPSMPLHEQAWKSGALMQQLGSPSLTLVPMGCDDDTHCLVEVVSAGPLGPDEERVVRGVQRFYRHLRALMDENERDSLTRLLNRKSFDETFVRMAMQLDGGPLVDVPAAGGRRKSPDPADSSCWLAVIDIDHFKCVNDRHGHLIGDEVLILVAQLIRKTFRTADRLYRFGGEEFVVLLRNASAGDAMRAFERLRCNVERFEFPQVGTLTVSIGYTEVQANDTPSAAFERADQAVYHAKSHGRNLVVDRESLLRSGDVPVSVVISEVEFF